MWMPRIRFTVRRMMAAVVIAALALGGERVRRHREWCIERAKVHGFEAESYALYGDEDLYEPSFDPSTTAEEMERQAAVRRKNEADEASLRRSKSTYHSALRAKYERAARYPWLPVAPDPPEPK